MRKAMDIVAVAGLRKSLDYRVCTHRSMEEL